MVPALSWTAYDPATVYSSIDSFGRYAYGNQPRIAQWNLARLAEALLPLLAEDQDAAVEMANEALGGFAGRFEAAYAEGPPAQAWPASGATGRPAPWRRIFSTAWRRTARTSR